MQSAYSASRSFVGELGDASSDGSDEGEAGAEVCGGEGYSEMKGFE
jgi:hypothetical protein